MRIFDYGIKLKYADDIWDYNEDNAVKAVDALLDQADFLYRHSYPACEILELINHSEVSLEIEWNWLGDYEPKIYVVPNGEPEYLLSKSPNLKQELLATIIKCVDSIAAAQKKPAPIGGVEPDGTNNLI